MTIMTYVTGEEARNHAQAFAEELRQLLERYQAEIEVETTFFGYNGVSSEIVIDFGCCDARVEVGTWSDGSDLEVTQ